jgi:magnesium and cobalt exporter, CNNM family
VLLEDIPLSWLFGALAAMIVASAFFSIAETAMMAINRFRLKYLASEGNAGAVRVQQMLKRTDRLLGGILIGNTLAITVATTISGLITVRLFGDDKIAYFVSPIVVGFLIIVFAEITPKVIGATHPERVALLLSFPLKFTLRTLDLPAWFVNLFVRPLLWMLRLQPESTAETPKLSPEEIRTLVLESSAFMPKKHVSILMNLFDLGDITVQDIMLPRAGIESITLEEPMESIVRQLATSTHRRLPVYRDREGEVIGVLHLRKILDPLRAGTLTKEAIEALLVDPYFVPASTPVFAQLQYFQEARENIALVVDEYGEVMGLVTLEDILEEIVGKFTLALPSATRSLSWDASGTALADGSMQIREVNRALGLDLPLDGPKTLNGLILEHLQDIPEADVSVKIGGVVLEITHAQGRTVKTVRLFKPTEAPVEEAA